MQKRIETERLSLRPFIMEDAPKVAHLAGDKQIADMTANIPHPYTLAHALGWIKTHQSLWQNREALIYAITLKDLDAVLGVVSITQLKSAGGGELGYWLGAPYWGKGYATEAAKGLIEHAVAAFELKQLNAQHLVDNDRSRSVILKLGFNYLENRTNTLQGKSRELCVYKCDLSSFC